MAQDAHFLEAFSSAYQAAVKKAAHARDLDAEEVLKTLLHGVAEELEMHASYAKVPTGPWLHQIVGIRNGQSREALGMLVAAPT